MYIVFVHLNTPVPKHLELNLGTSIQLFPGHQVVLIHNEKDLEKKVTKMQGLTLYKYCEDERQEKLDSLYSHPKDFRGNFWLTSTVRFFALEQFSRIINDEILHLESDVIISKDFPFNRLRGLDKGLAFPVISEERGVGSVIYLRNAESCRMLCSNILDEAKKNPQTTEMIMLKKLWESNSESMRLLPIGPFLTNAYNDPSGIFISQLLENFTKFGGAFDGVDIGQYFLGTDPKNRRGKVLLRHNLVKGFADIVNWEIQYNREREFLDILLNGSKTKTPLYALHVAVKENRYFRGKTRARALQRVVRIQHKKASSYLSPTAFFRSARDSAKRKVTRFLRTEKNEF